MNKKIIAIIAVVIVVVVAIFGIRCINKNKAKTNVTQDNVNGSLSEIMDKLYAGIPEDELPMLEKTEVTPENVEYYLGTTEIDYKEALASEPMMTSIAHSVVLVRTKEGANTKEIAQKIKNSVNPRKWICVGVEDDEVKVETKGNLIVLVMLTENGDKVVDNFNNL